MGESTSTETSTDSAYLAKQLTWVDGLAMAAAMSTGLISSLGYTVGAIGAWGALAVWGAATVVALLQNHLYAEMATMFPKESGGISLYALQGWKRHLIFVGPIAAFGYWLGWSLTLGVLGVTIGYIVQAEWLPHATWSADLGAFDLTLPLTVGIAAIVLSWALNIVGIRVAAMTSRLLAAVFAVFVVLVMVAPFLAGGWSASNLTWRFGDDGVKVFLVWMFVAAWSVYGTETTERVSP